MNRANSVQSILLDKLVAHPDNPNRMSRANFAKLVRNIKQTGLYEPIVVRPHRINKDCFEIINGHHRCQAIAQLGYKQADVIVWDIDDEQANVLLATLNRLGGSDKLGGKIELLKKLNRTIEAGELAKILPQGAKQIERLINLKRPAVPVKINAEDFANPLVFFLTDKQKQIVEKALSMAQEPQSKQTKAVKNTNALICIAKYFIDNSTTNSGD